MRHCNNVHCVRLDSVVDSERKPIEKNSASSYSAEGYRFGACRIRCTAIDSSCTKAVAASRLRSSYHAWASSTSRNAAGWKSTFIQPIEKALTNFLPRNAPDSTRVELGYPSFNFSGPRRLDIFVGLSFERFDKQRGKVCPILFREFGRFLPQIRECPAHGSILSLPPTRDINIAPIYERISHHLSMTTIDTASSRP